MTDPALSFRALPGQGEGTMILRLEGPLTIQTIFGFQQEFRAMKPPVLIVDLSACPYMDSAGLGLLVNQYVSAENGKRHLLIVGVNHRIQALLELTKVDSVLCLLPTVPLAEASLLKLHPRPADPTLRAR